MRGLQKTILALTAGLVAWGVPTLAAAQTQIRPRVIIMVDTSGSMTEDFAGNGRDGDGSSSYTDTLIGTRNNFYTGFSQAATTCPATAPFFGNTSKMFAAKAAVTNVINGSGDIDWGLMRYSGTQCPTTAVPVAALGASADTCYNDNDCTGTSNGCTGNVCTCNGTGASGRCRSGFCNGGICGCDGGADCRSGTCAASGFCTCNNDDQCQPGAFCNTTTHACFFDSNLCFIGQYGMTDVRQRAGTCGNHVDLPTSYGGDCGPADNATGAVCTTMQTCFTAADCGPSSLFATPGGANGGCTQLGNGPVNVCSCTTDTQCPRVGGNGAQMFTCQFVSGAAGPKVCKYNQPCDSGGAVTGGVVTGGGGFIVVDPATGAASTSILPWVDGVENETVGLNFNPELRAVGNTPLGGAARTAAVWYSNIRDTAADSKIACRPYVLVQMTDGVDTCENDDNGKDANNFGPVAAAQDFVSATKDGARVPNKVYVIGLAAAGFAAELNAIAYAGGSGAARFATSQSDIEAALADIVASSVLIEKCNYVDDDCNGFVDEEYPDVAPSPTPNPQQFGRPCGNGAAGHCAATGRFKCSTDQLSETCGPVSCRLGAGTSLTKVGNVMTLNGVSAFAAGDVGQSISIVSARLAANNGVFVITAQTGTSVSFTNAAGAAENNPVGYEIYCAAQVTCRQGNGTSLTRAGNSVTLAGVSGFLAADVGNSVTITSATNAANVGTFPITAQAGNSVTFSNNAGITEVSSVGYSINCRSPSCRRATTAASLTKAGNVMTLTNGSGFAASDVGSIITINSATNGGNQGNFTITTFNSATSVSWTNANGVAEAGAVQWNIYCANAESLGGCNNFDDDCNGVPDDCTQGVAGSCCTTNGCSPVELCNGIDDDCNGIIDDNPVDVGGSCGSNVGDCAPGTVQCCTGTLAAPGTCPGHAVTDSPLCLGGNQPKPADLCDGTDDNCDGVVNGVPPQVCYTSPTGTVLLTPGQDGIGLCRAGSQSCNTVALGGSCPPIPAGNPCPNGTHTFTACQGAVGPQPETCNGFDDDCDGTPDDHLTDPWIGMPCCPTGNLADCQNTGGGTRCSTGTFICNASGAQQCMGGVAKSPEICDGIDNDCNGIPDDVPGLNSPCTANGTTNQGTCRAVFICVPATPGTCDGQPCPNGLTCDQQTGPSPEVCNGLDDDCDGVIDEPDEVAANDSSVGKDCDVPVAPADQPPCKKGETVCVDGKVECEGAVHPMPNQCDGTGVSTDCTGQPNPNGNCPEGATCFQGNCVTPCGDGEFPCPGGFVCDRTQTPALCIPDACAKASCPTGDVCNVGPDGKAQCVDPCSNIDCGSGFRCVGGACVDDSCRTFGCPAGQLCTGNPAACVADPCFNVTCNVGDYCSNGDCVPVCTTCMKGETCVKGVCETDPCNGVICAEGQVCSPTGGCVQNVCASLTCGAEQVCCGGGCVNDPCQLVACSAGTVCTIDDVCNASCTTPAQPPKDQIVGAGGGGFACDVGAGRDASEGLWWMVLIAGLLVLRGRRRKQQSEVL